MMDKQVPTVIFLIGCTASGKGAVGRLLAESLDAEILSVDSMKVYCRMDIGTAKPSAEHRARLPHHLIDVAQPWESFSAARFVQLAQQAIGQIHSRGRITVGIGGSVLYLKALTEGIFEGPGSDLKLRDELLAQAEKDGPAVLHQQLGKIDPQAAERIHPNDLRRVVRALEVFKLTGRPISSYQSQFGQLRSDYRMLFLGLRHVREQQNRRINARVKRMIELGLVDEVKSLFEEKPAISRQARQALGYAEIIAFLAGRYDLDRAIERIKINTRRFAKSQRTWFRQLSQVHWFDVPEENQAFQGSELAAPMLQFIKQEFTKNS